MSDNTASIVKALLLPINPAAVVLLGIYTVLWGFWVANPFWSVFSQAALYSQLKTFGPILWMHISPEVFWGVIAMVCGCVTIYGAFKRQYRPLIVGATVIGWHWFMISIFYFMGDWMNTGGITALIFAVYAAFIYLNVRVNFKDNGNIDDALTK